MKKIIFILLAINSSNAVYSAYLDDWTNDDLCGWMESTSTPEYIQKEIEKRQIICYEGVEVFKMPGNKSETGKNGTTFPSPDPKLLQEIHLRHILGREPKMSGY